MKSEAPETDKNQSFNLIESVGGEERYRAMITDFYDRIYDDIIIGFMFLPFDKKHLIESQMKWASSKLGDRSGKYDGPSIYKAHQHLPIHPGMFDRRHKILADVLSDWEVPDFVRDAWLSLDSALRDNVLRWGVATRHKMNNIPDSQTEDPVVKHS